MTLQSSFPLSASDINEELGRSASASFSMNGAAERWLAEKSSGSYSFSDFLGKTALKVVDEKTGSAGTNHSFSGVNFGTSFSGRRIAVIFFLAGKASGQTPSGNPEITNISIGGKSVNDVVLAYYQGGSGSTDFVGIAYRGGAPSGTSGTISFHTPVTTTPRIVVLATLEIGDAFDVASDWESSAAGTNVSVNIPSGGFLVAFALKKNSSNISWTGVTERGDATFASNYRASYGFNNRMNAQTGRTVSFTSTGNAPLVLGCIAEPLA